MPFEKQYFEARTVPNSDLISMKQNSRQQKSAFSTPAQCLGSSSAAAEQKAVRKKNGRGKLETMNSPPGTDPVEEKIKSKTSFEPSRVTVP